MLDYTRGHGCAKCGRPWTHDGCTVKLSSGLKVTTICCPTCNADSSYVADEWVYIEDEFTTWVKEVRKAAGVQ